MNIRSPRLQPGEFVFSDAKRVLQHYRGANGLCWYGAIATTTVSRGDSLWRLSRQTYGVGTRYSVIYKANREQIRNPNLIRPGQIFVLPAR